MSINKIVILTGAGISKESGLDTFRDDDGLWSSVAIEDVATPQAYAKNPQKVLNFYNLRHEIMSQSDINPNAAHLALSKLERKFNGETLLITQNIDTLHEQAGSKNILHMHGELGKVRCNACQAIADWEKNLSLDDSCAACDQVGQIRPHVIWFGELPLHLDAIFSALYACDLFISIGTSGNVYPAAGFVQQVRNNNRSHTVELNLDPSEGASLFSEAHYGPATEIVPPFIDRILQK